jgi:lysozyme
VQRTPNKECLELIKKAEGLRLDAYVCPAGVWTIGYGHTTGVTRGARITAEYAERLLLLDMETACRAVERMVKVPLTDNQFGALCSWVFNLGEGAVKNSTLIRLLNEGKLQEAADQFLRWNKVRNPKTKQLEPSKGLTTRREAERALFLKPDGEAIA